MKEKIKELFNHNNNINFKNLNFFFRLHIVEPFVIIIVMKTTNEEGKKEYEEKKIILRLSAIFILQKLSG